LSNPGVHALSKRILLILPCCIGDVVLATATLKALRRGYPDAHITWAVGSWSKAAVENHPLLDAVLDTGPAALPVKSPEGFLRFVRQIRAGRFDLAVSLVRSPLMSLAVLLSGIPQRAGLDSAGRGFGYNIRAPIDPSQPRHEADIYLDVPRALGLDVRDCYANIPVSQEDQARIRQLLKTRKIEPPYMVINPAGGRNPGMALDIKRWPPENFAELGQRLQVGAHGRAPLHHPHIPVVLIGGPGDQPIIDAVHARLDTPATSFVGQLSFGQIAALAADALLYIGNDTGLTHLAAAAGAKTVMILGPSDPARYAPFTPNAIALWKPGRVVSGGVWAGVPEDWSWARDGVSVDEAETRIRTFLGWENIFS
jgi:ADP-heptose:LPS heptosyltransferase